MISVTKEMTMLGRIIILHFALCFFYAAAHPVKEACKDVKCLGPVKFYEELQCKPVYKNPDDCCAIKYDCKHLEDRSPDRCYANGKEYKVGEELLEVARCDHNCFCNNKYNNLTQFVCIESLLFIPDTDPGCYRERNATACYPGPQICPEKPEDIPKCMVDGKLINHGEYFQPEADENKECYCGPGFDGKFVEPYCKDNSQSLYNRRNCEIDIGNRAELENHCAPIYREHQSPLTDCHLEWECQNDEFKVIEKEEKPEGIEEGNSKIEDMFCRIGKLKMQIGDELSHVTSWDTHCVKCSCDVPPAPTCQYTSPDVCDLPLVKE